MAKAVDLTKTAPIVDLRNRATDLETRLAPLEAGFAVGNGNLGAALADVTTALTALDAHVAVKDAEIDAAVSVSAEASTFANTQGDLARTQGEFSKDAGDTALLKAAAAQAAVDAAAPIFAGADILGARTQAVGAAASALSSASKIGGLNDNLSGAYVSIASTEWVPIVVSAATGDQLLAVRAGADGVAEIYDNGRFVGKGVANAIVDQIIPLAGLTTTLQLTDIDAVLVAQDDGTVMLGFDRASGVPIIHGLDDLIAQNIGVTRAPTPLSAGQTPNVVDWKGTVSNGESLSIGATGNPAINTTPVYGNLTFLAGPKATKAGSSAGGSNPGTNGLKPLVEDDLAGDNKTGRGQTMCFTAAKHAVERGALLRGVDPTSYVWVSSTAGKGGFRLDDLDMRTDLWAQNFVDHVTGMRDAAALAGKSFALTTMPIHFGVNDGAAGTSFADCVTRLRSMIAWQTAAVMEITGQTVPPHALLTQSPIYATLNSGPALAVLEVSKDPYVHLVGPMYPYPHNPVDQIHETNVGYAWNGYAVGRAQDQLVAGYEPDCIRPTRSFIRGRVIRTYFDAPTGLKLNTTVGKVTDFGFAVGPKGSTLPIASVVASGSFVDITLAADTTGTPELRFGLDYGLAGLLAGSGAGNLSDSTQDTATILGQTVSLAHWCPLFVITPTRLEPA